jgi:hypothetical protein
MPTAPSTNIYIDYNIISPHATILPMKRPDPSPEAADPEWFREPTLRELRMGAGLFIGFGIFFVLMYILYSDSRFRWVLLGLGVISMIRGLKHLVEAIRKNRAS